MKHALRFGLLGLFAVGVASEDVSRAAGLEVMDIAGLQYDPVREQCSLTADPSVNYLMHLKRRPAGTA